MGIHKSSHNDHSLQKALKTQEGTPHYRQLEVLCPVCGKRGVHVTGSSQYKHKRKVKGKERGFIWETTYCDMKKEK